VSLFDQLVDQALQNQAELAPLRGVVEKELLHHDIIREMSAAGLLGELTFIGGTCLRACYGSNRLSEDLDFTGGGDFRREVLSDLGDTLVDRLQTKYGLAVEVSEPGRDTGNVDTWKLKVVTRPNQKELPAQRINIDICAIPSYDRQPMVLRNQYGVDMGTAGLIIQAQSREEILADKMIAFALRPNRLKHRDLWDIGWLKQQNIELPLDLIPGKIADHQYNQPAFLTLLAKRSKELLSDPGLRTDFIREMKRFLPPRIVTGTIEQTPFWDYLTRLVVAECQAVTQALEHSDKPTVFKM
jgi:predicted nucleotidyltransferase component of viral defense system